MEDSPNVKPGLEEVFKNLMSILPDLATHVDQTDTANLLDENSVIGKLANLAKYYTAADHIHVRVINWSVSDLALIYINDALFDKSDTNMEDFYRLKPVEAVSGRVFTEKRVTRAPDIQSNAYFTRYRNNYLQNTKYWEFLGSFGSILSAPLLFRWDNHTKAIGIINAIMRRQGEGSSKEFTREDEVILECIADQITLALHNAWLFETAKWQPRSSENILELCQEIVDEALRKTGANNGKVRFVDWQGKYLVPGVIQGVKDSMVVPSNSTGSEPDYTRREIGMCLAGLAAAKREARSSNDLWADADFIRFSENIEACIAQSDRTSQVLMKIRGTIEENPQDCSGAILPHENTGNTSPPGDMGLGERLKILKERCQDPDNAKAVLDRMVAYIGSSRKEWVEYQEILKKLKSEIAVPIIFGTRLFGVLNVHSDKKDWFSESDRIILQILATRVASILMDHQYKRFKEIHCIEREMTATRRYNAVAEQLHDGIIKTISLSERDAAGEERIFPLLYSFKNPLPPEKLVLSTFANNYHGHTRRGASKVEKELLKVPIREEGLGKLAVRELSNKSGDDAFAAFIAREKVDDPISNGSESAQNEGVMTTACLPLVYERTVYGLLYIHIKVRHFFTELERELLTLFAQQAAIIIKNWDRDNYSAIYGTKLYDDAIER